MVMNPLISRSQRAGSFVLKMNCLNMCLVKGDALLKPLLGNSEKVDLYIDMFKLNNTCFLFHLISGAAIVIILAIAVTLGLVIFLIGLIYLKR